MMTSRIKHIQVLVKDSVMGHHNPALGHEGLGLSTGAGALFIAADAFFTYGQPQRWIQRLFRRAAHPSMQRADVDRAVPHASTRIVGALHILIQVGAPCCSIPCFNSMTWDPLQVNVLRDSGACMTVAELLW